jgi:hypothetical protein
MIKIHIDDLIAQARPLPWPVNSAVVSEGSLTPAQLVATRILRRHAANQLPSMLHALKVAYRCMLKNSCNEDPALNHILEAIYSAENVNVEDF